MPADDEAGGVAAAAGGAGRIGAVAVDAGAAAGAAAAAMGFSRARSIGQKFASSENFSPHLGQSFIKAP